MEIVVPLSSQRSEQQDECEAQTLESETSPLAAGAYTAAFLIQRIREKQEKSKKQTKGQPAKQTKQPAKQVTAQVPKRAKESDSDEYWRRYADAFAEATLLIFEKRAGISKETSQQVIARLNQEYDLTGDKKLSRTTLFRAIKNGHIGVRPCKPGPALIVPVHSAHYF